MTNLKNSLVNYSIQAKPWAEQNILRKILAIRLQALGDLVITLPYLQYLKRNLPEVTKLDLLTRKEVDEIPKNIILFDKVYSIGGGRNYKKQIFLSSFLLPELFLNKYDAIIDLQNNTVSRFITKSLFPKSCTRFDRFSTIAAGDRTKSTIEALGIGNCYADTNFKLKNESDGFEILKNNGWNIENNLVILNPAGAFKTRNWPVENYIGFANLWLHKFPKTQFAILGVENILGKANYLKEKLGEKLINLVNRTTIAQAFSVVQQSKFVLSEDSGLMHMAWVSGIPTLTLFGSTRSDWARPLGNHTFFHDSSDLECGNCMKEICKHGDNRCMTRYKPQEIFENAMDLFLNK